MSEERDAIATVKRFFFAVTIGDGEAVWDELGSEARAYVLNVALQQGMDFELASRLRQGTASQEEVAEYQENLVWGLSRDLDGIDLSNLAYECEDLDGGRVRVRYLVPLGLTLGTTSLSPTSVEGGREATIPAGSVVTTKEDGRWCVQRLVPRPA